jgi:hypothetical protein
VRTDTGLHLDIRRDARRWFRRWASDVAKGGPRPPNGMILRAGAALAVPQPCVLLDSLAEAAKQDPAILGIDEVAGNG